MMRDIHFINRFTATNIGDRWSSPHHYFEFDGFNKVQIEQGSKSWEAADVFDTHFCTILGGGLQGRQILASVRQYQPSSKLVYWGGGWPRLLTDPMKKYKEHVIDFPFGLRDYSTHIEHVPCASCMLPQLDKKYDIKREIGIYYNSGYKKRPWYNKDTDIRYLSQPRRKGNRCGD